MKRFLRAFFIFRRCPGFVPDIEWQLEDAVALRYFLASPAGAKFRLVLASNIANGNDRAALSKGDAFTCGMACGFKALHAWIMTLSAPQEESPASEHEDPFGAAADLDHLAP